MKQYSKILFTLMVMISASVALWSCMENEEGISDTVWGTDIPVSELRNGEVVSAETFKAITTGRYYFYSDTYCRWNGNSLEYLPTGTYLSGEKYYGLEGCNHEDANESGRWYYHFEDGVEHVYNDLWWLDYRYNYSYNNETGSITMDLLDVGRQTCKVLYIDEKRILLQTDVYRPSRQTIMARVAAAKADFVLIHLGSVKPTSTFLNYTDWEVHELQ